MSDARPPEFLDALRALCDLQRITATVREFADAIEDPERLDTLNQLLRKTGLRP